MLIRIILLPKIDFLCISEIFNLIFHGGQGQSQTGLGGSEMSHSSHVTASLVMKIES